MPPDIGALDERRRRYHRPFRIVHVDGPVVDAEALLDASSRAAKLSPGAWIVLDFGREMHGGVRIEGSQACAHRPIRVRVRFGESVSETLGEPDNDHAIHDHEVEIPWFGFSEIGQTGFRFVRIDLIDDVPLTVERIAAVALELDIACSGAFECDDERINSVWKTCARTVHLCMQDHVWDGIKRDRLPWIGDMHPEAAVISALYGAHPIVPRSLDFVRDATPLPGWMHGISSYSLWWVIIQRDWLISHGNLAYAAEQRDYLAMLLDQVEACVDDSGQERLTTGRFLEWATARDSAAIDSGLQALVVLALLAGADLAEAIEEPDIARKARLTAERAGRVRRPSGPSLQANALLVLAGMADPVRMNASILAPDPCRGLSPFYGYYVLEARALAGDIAGGLDVLRTYWGGMLDLGATSFWEHFDLEWLDNAGRIDEMPTPGKRDVHAECGDHCYKGLRHSLCHGWAGGPAAWLMRRVLGVTPESPGFSRVRIVPNLGGLTYVRGVVPTPHGPIVVEHEAKAGEVMSHVELPGNVVRVEN